MTNAEKLKILILDDEKDFVEEIQEYLTWKGFNDIYTAGNMDAALKILCKNKIDIMFLDYKLPKISGLEILKVIKSDYPEIEVIMMSGHGDMDTVIEALRLGAIDFLRKPFSNEQIMIAIQRIEKFVIQEHKLKNTEEKVSLISQDLESKIERNFIGQSEAINEVLRLAMVAAEHENTNVIITGESGTGKEIVARIIHHASKRNKNNFCIVNCAAIPSNLLESEFFGHMKGAFTGAFDARKGFFEMTDKGTIFLDEIGEMPIELQSKLLRAIEEQKVKRIGGEREISFDCRIISATNIDIQKAIEENKFRLDLFHRLQTIEIKIPPLRERKEDIPILLHYFAEELAQKLNKTVPTIGKSTVTALMNYHFPGNVRELRNLVERAIIISKDSTIDIIEGMVNPNYNNEPIQVTEKLVVNMLNLKDIEVNRIKSALQETKGNQTKAAQILGISRTALIRRIKKYQLNQ
jgi:DNA-binding NtrC family response regulator